MGAQLFTGEGGACPLAPPLVTPLSMSCLMYCIRVLLLNVKATTSLPQIGLYLAYPMWSSTICNSFLWRGLPLRPSFSILSFVLDDGTNVYFVLVVSSESCELSESLRSTGDWRVVFPHATGNWVFHALGPAIHCWSHRTQSRQPPHPHLIFGALLNTVLYD